MLARPWVGHKSNARNEKKLHEGAIRVIRSFRLSRKRRLCRRPVDGARGALGRATGPGVRRSDHLPDDATEMDRPRMWTLVILLEGEFGEESSVGTSRTAADRRKFYDAIVPLLLRRKTVRTKTDLFVSKGG